MFRFLLYAVFITLLLFIPLNIFKQETKQNVKLQSSSIKVKLTRVPEPPKVRERPVVKKKKPVEKPIERKLVKKKPQEKKKKPIEKKTKVLKKEPLPEPKAQEPQEPKEIQKESPQDTPKLEQTPLVSESKSVKSVDKNESQEYYDAIYQEIDKNKKYPKQAIRFKQEDVIPVVFMVNGEGEIYDFKIIKKSSYPSLNKAVEKIFKKVKKLQKPPLGTSLPLEVKISINFKLEKE